MPETQTEPDKTQEAPETAEAQATEAERRDQGHPPRGRLDGQTWEDVRDEGPGPLAEEDGADEPGSPEALAREEADAAENTATTEPVVGGDPVEVDGAPDAQALECQICGRLWTGVGLGAGHANCGHGIGAYRPVAVVKRDA